MDAIVSGLRKHGYDNLAERLLRNAGDGADNGPPKKPDGPNGPGCPFNSFSADTLVMTDEGLRPISSLAWGDMVLAYNELTGEIDYYPIIATIVHDDQVVQLLTIDGETIITTPNHPFYTGEGEWLAAGKLQVGGTIRNGRLETGTVESISFVYAPQPLYNLTVATAHTYFVGDGQWLVHNCLIGNKTVAEVAGNTPIKPGMQGSVTESRVEQYAQDMLDGSFNWDRMAKFGRPDPIMFARRPNGELVLMEGHHRFLAAQLTGTPIPFDNPNAVVYRDLPDAWPSGEWSNYVWR